MAATNLYHFRALWTGFVGSPGYSNIYMDAGIVTGSHAHNVQAFFESIKNMLPGVVTIQVENSGFIIDAATGVQTGTWNETAITPTTGTDHVPFNGVAGVTVNWRTADLSPKGRQIQGRTFIVPSSASSFDTSTGRLSDAFHTVLQGAADTLIASSPGAMQVWTRPTSAGASNGAAHEVTSARVAREGQFLTSRRQ